MNFIPLISAIFLSWHALAAEPSLFPWPNFRGNSQNNGNSLLPLREASFGSSKPGLFSTRGIIWGTPVVDEENNIYVGTSAKLFHKLSPLGKQLWEFHIRDLPDSLIDSAAALTSTGKVIVPGGDGFLHALDRKTGRELWAFGANDADPGQLKTGETVNSFEGNVTVSGGRIFAGCDNGYLYAIDDQGKKIWSFRTGMMVWSSPAFAPDGSWLAVGSLDRNLYLLEPKTGKLLAKFSAGGDIKSSPATDGENLYLGTSAEEILAVHVSKSANGYRLEQKWKFPAVGEVYSSPAVKNGSVFVGTLRGYVYSLSAESGKLQWEFNARSPVAASPLLSADDSLVFGAKNSKLYVLNAANGERLWSYRTSDSLYKSNLDSSPSLFRGEGGEVHIAVGSYSGKVFLVPAGYCARAKSDPACELGGSEDSVAYKKPMGPDEAELRYVDREGRLLAGSNEMIGLFEPVQLQLIAQEGGHQISNAAISVFPLRVEIEPKTELRSVVSSDGTLLNLLPVNGFLPGTKYKIHVKGRYYRNTHWVWNRFKWLGLKPFTGEIQVETQAASVAKTELKPYRLWGVHSLYLTQPQALDTYIPAALDGQAFLVTGFGFREGTGKFLMLAQPALPSGNRPIPLPEPSKSFVLEADRSGRDFVARGSMAIAAMGGAMKFDEAQLTGSFTETGAIDRGEFFVNSSCLGIKGNGSSYQFPLSLVSWVCDSHLHVIGLGPLSGQEFPMSTNPGLSASLDGPSLLIRDPGVTLQRTAPHLLNVVEYDPDTVKVAQFAAIELTPACWQGSECRLRVPNFSKGSGTRKTVLFLGQLPIAL